MKSIMAMIAFLLVPFLSAHASYVTQTVTINNAVGFSAMALSADEKLLVVVQDDNSGDCVVSVLDLMTLTTTHSFPVPKNNFYKSCNQVGISDDNKVVAVLTYETDIQGYDIKSGVKLWTHQTEVRDGNIVFSKKLKKFIFASFEKIFLLDPSTGLSQSIAFLNQWGNYPWILKLDETGEHLNLSMDGEGTYTLDLTAPQLPAQFIIPLFPLKYGLDDSIYGSWFTPDRKHVVFHVVEGASAVENRQEEHFVVYSWPDMMEQAVFNSKSSPFFKNWGKNFQLVNERLIFETYSHDYCGTAQAILGVFHLKTGEEFVLPPFPYGETLPVISKKGDRIIRGTFLPDQQTILLEIVDIQ